jgi:hypothetical protein
MINKSIKKRKFSRLLSAFLWVMAGFVVLSMDMFAQNYEFTLNQRRMGDTIGVEVWVKTLDANAANLGNMTIAIRYNNSFLSPAAIEYKAAYGNPAAATDSISSDVSLSNPVITLPSSFSDGTYGYSTLDAQAATGVVGSETIYTFQLDVNLSPSGAGYPASTSGRGTFVGMLKFKLKNYASITDLSYTGIQFNATSSSFAPSAFSDKNGTNVSNLCTLTNPANFTVRGITIMNPNYPNQTVNRYPQAAYAGLGTNLGYPIYFERSGLDNSLANYGTETLAYKFQYSLDNATTWTNIGYVAEKTSAVLLNPTYYVSGELAPVSGTNNSYITKGNGDNIVSGYSGVLRTIWSEDPVFAIRSEQARMKIIQIKSSGTAADITARDTTRNDVTRYDINDIQFVLGRLFFAQLDGTQGYFRSERPFSNATLLTVEAWVNLNSIQSATGAEPAIVASSAGPASSEEGAWMLYLKDGMYPAFRAREIEGRGTGGYIGTVVAVDPLAISDPAVPITDIHAENWVHIAAVVNMNEIILYVNGEEVGRSINEQAVNIRMLTSNQPIWIGLNPNGTIDASDYLNAGIKEVQIWRAALPIDSLRKHISGVYQPSIAFQGDFRSTLELYYPLQASRLDMATNVTYQNSSNNLNYFENTNLTSSAINENIKYRPDRGHIRLTSPTGNEGISNLKGRTYPVRWVTYGIGSQANGTGDLMIQVSRDGGLTWFDAIDNQVPAMPYDDVDAESVQVLWESYNNTTITGQDDDLQGVIDLTNNYTKSVLLKISGTETNNQSNLADTSGRFIVAPHFALKNAGTAILRVDGNTDMNMTEGITVLEAWIRPYRFPSDNEGYFPIVAKKSDDGANLDYALKLLPTGQLRLSVGTSGGVVDVTSTSNIDSVVKVPNLFESDTAWTHVAVVTNLASGTGQSNVYFFIDGARHAANTSLGSAVTVATTNSYPVYIGYEPGAVSDINRTFVGEMKEVRFWNGYPGGQDVVDGSLTTFLQGALSVRANELGTFNGTDYAANLVAAYSMDGGSFINSGMIRTIPAYPTNALLNAKASGIGYAYVATKPLVKFIVPVYKQKVPNTTTDLVLRWVGFDYNRNDLASFYAGTSSHHADMEYSVEGGGGVIIQPYQYVASEFWNPTFTNALTIPSNLSGYEFPGTTSKSQFAAKLDVSISDPDSTDDETFLYQSKLAAANSNARLRLSGRSTINGYLVEYENNSGTDGYMPSLRTESQIFTVTPQSNFTVRALLEGYHTGSVNGIQVDLTTDTRSARGNGLDIELYENNANNAGNLVVAAGLAGNYLSKLVANRNSGSNNFANVPFILDTIPDGRYFVKVNHLNHLSVMSKWAAPFKFSGDNPSTWALESGWDFQNWNGDVNDVISLANSLTEPPTMGNSYSAFGDVSRDTSNTLYATTALVYNNGANTSYSTSTNQLPALVGGDVFRDGRINSLDRSKVVADDGSNVAESDVTGDGFVNATDRQIVYRNNGKEEDPTMPAGIPVPSVKPVIPMAPEYADLLPGSEELTIMFIDAEKAFASKKDKNAKVTKAITPYLQAGGIKYEMSATVIMNGDFIDVSMYAKNTGVDFGFGNCTFGLKYEENKLHFVEMQKNQNVIFSDRPTDLGYFPSFTAPAPNANEPIIGLRTIDIDFENQGIKNMPGTFLPRTETYLGTLRFKRIDNAQAYNFSWHKISVVYTVDGKNITADGTFLPIKSVVLNPDITLTFPNGGESLTAGRPYTITWTKASTSKPAYIEFSNDNGINWQRLTASPVDMMTGSYNWITPKINSTKCLVRLVDAVSGNVIDKSDAAFSLISTPALITRPASTDKPYKGGASDYIRWETEQNINVKFEFSENGVSNWKQVTSVVQANKLEISWVLPSVNSKTAVVRMINSDNGEVVAVSTPFKILAGSLTLTSPREGERIQVGSKKPVRWTYDNVNTFDLYLSVNSGKDWNIIETDVKAVNKSIDWMVPNANTKHAIIKAIYTNDPELEYNRTGEFEIYGGTDVDNPEIYGYAIESVTPNPFTTETVISFKLPNSENVTITVYDANGSAVANLANNQMFNAGINTVTFKNNNLAAGLYIVRINAGMFNLTKDIIHIK